MRLLLFLSFLSLFSCRRNNSSDYEIRLISTNIQYTTPDVSETWSEYYTTVTFDYHLKVFNKSKKAIYIIIPRIFENYNGKNNSVESIYKSGKIKVLPESDFIVTVKSVPKFKVLYQKKNREPREYDTEFEFVQQEIVKPSNLILENTKLMYENEVVEKIKN